MAIETITTITCDRCGALISKMSKRFRSEYHFMNSRKEKWNRTNTFLLCKECKTDFGDFMRGSAVRAIKEV